MADGRLEAVVFDLGGVVLDWDPLHLYRRVFDDEGEAERFVATVCTLEWHVQHDAGTPMDETIPLLVEAHPHLETEIRAWRDRYVEMVAGYVPGMEQLIADLEDAGLPLYALTNMPADVVGELLDAFPLLRQFEGMIVSGQELVMKPDPEIYHRLARRFGLVPARTVFVDDRADNVDAAWTLGFRAVRFESAAHLRRLLARWGIAIPEPADG